MFQEKYQNAHPKDITDNTILVIHVPSYKYKQKKELLSIVNLNRAFSKVVLNCCSLCVVRYKVSIHNEGNSN